MMFDYAATVTHIVDGDTVDLTVDLGFRITNNDRFRLLGINSPERGRPGWAEATAELAKLMPVGSQVTIHSEKPLSKEKYGRWLARILNADGTDVNQAMIDGGFAVEYNP
jgi:micrococcal nuclease